MEVSPVPRSNGDASILPTPTGIRIGFLGAGALLGLGLALVRTLSVQSELEPGSIAKPVSLWVADRDGGAVYGLDGDLLLARRTIVDWPIAVAARPDGGAWVLRSTGGSPHRPARLLRLDSEGGIRSETELPECAGLASLVDGSAIVLEKAGEAGDEDRVVRFDEAGRVEILHRGGELTCVAGSTGSFAVGDAHGTVMRISIGPGMAVMAENDLRERVLEIDADPIGEHFWVLTAAERARIHRLDAELVVRWSADAGSSSTSIASRIDPIRIWLVDGARSRVRCIDQDGVLELERGELPFVGSASAVRDARGGISIASPGCVLDLDSTGRIRAALGGFTHAVDIDRVP